jgi:hypothetical protein
MRTPALKKPGKGDDDFRFQGTFLGKETEPQPVIIAGGDATLADFMDRYKAKVVTAAIDHDEDGSPGDSSILSSAPVTPNADNTAVGTVTVSLSLTPEAPTLPTETTAAP